MLLPRRLPRLQLQRLQLHGPCRQRLLQSHKLRLLNGGLLLRGRSICVPRRLHRSAMEVAELRKALCRLYVHGSLIPYLRQILLTCWWEEKRQHTSSATLYPAKT